MTAERTPFQLLCAALAAAIVAGCGGGGIATTNPDGFPPEPGHAPGSPCRAADDPAGPCDQDLGGAEFVDMVCLSGTCVVDCADGGDFLCMTVVAPFLTCSSAAGDVCVRACGADGGCSEGYSCYDGDLACLPTGSFPGSPCRDDAAAPCDAVGGAPMTCTSTGVCAVDCGAGGADLCRTVDAGLTCSSAAGDVCVYDCAAGCPGGYSCLDSEGACLPTGGFPGSPCLAATVGAEPSCGALPNPADAANPIAMSCTADVCVVPCQGGASDDARCAAVDPSLGCSAAGGACVPTCVDGACPDGFSCFGQEDRCLPIGSFPTSPCGADSPCSALSGPGGIELAMACVAGQCVIPCYPSTGDALCGAVDASLGCSDTAGACVPVCNAGACPDGFSCFDQEERCLPTGAFPGSPCRADVEDPCDQDLLGHPDVDMACVNDLCLVGCAGGGDYLCGQVDPSLACSAAAGDVCVPRCDGAKSCPAGLSCFASEGTCLPTGSFPGSPCPTPGAAGCGAIPGLGDMVCAQPDPALGPLCLVDCAAGGTGLCQQLDAGLSCYAATGAPALCLPNGTFPGSLCRDATEDACDRDLQGQSDVDLACVAGTCQLACTVGGDTLCTLIGVGMGLPVGALTCVDAGGAGSFCARAGCASGGAACPADHHCDPSFDACLPYLPVTVIHTSDLGSHFDGVGPAGNAPVGGFARLASVVRGAQQRANARGALLLTLDGGGFTQGTLFALLQGTVEFELLRYLGYDAAALGARELDWGPGAFAAMLARDTGTAPILPGVISAVLGCAVGSNGCPALAPVPVLASNIHFDPTASDDDALAALFDTTGATPVASAPLKRFVVLDRGGLKVGVFAVMGQGAAEVTPGKAPITFDDSVTVAHGLVAQLRNPPWNADLVIAVSHAQPAPPPYLGDDELLAIEVPGIDVIVGGRGGASGGVTRIGDTWIVRAGAAGRLVGELELGWPLTPYGPAAGRIDGTLGGASLSPVDLTVAPDAVLTAARSAYVGQVNGGLSGAGLSYGAAIGMVDRSYASATLAEAPLGDLVADAVRWRTTQAVATSADTRVIDVAVVAHATLGDPVALDPVDVPTTVTLADVFAAVPYGASPTAPSLPGWPIVEFYLEGSALAQVLEVGLTVGALRGDAFWLDVSGLRVAYDPTRPPFHRVTGIWLDPSGAADVCSAATNLIGANGALKNPAFRYRVAMNLFAAGSLAQLEALTEGALAVTAQTSAGATVDPATRPAPGGVWGGQLREWQALVDHLATLTSQAGGPIPPPTGGRWLDPAALSAACSQ